MTSTTSNTLTLITHHHQLTDLILKSADIPREIKSLLIGISSFYNLRNDNAFPTRKLLSERTGYSANYITHLIAKAVKHGYLKVTPQFRQVEGEKGPRQTSNIYNIVLSKLGGFYSKTKAAMNIACRKRNKEKSIHQEKVQSRIDFVDSTLKQANPSQTNKSLTFKDYDQVE
ncbi:hypothetical protein [Vibrio sp. AND4]|uniref:hypothetical protein n=1 Tax=Vibrio sp. AND4 TaxID=314289 RepID=UPI00015F2C04|nr:hypothetical protein [Vibrio sp. AND4]EDP57985.1 hypothetical protein AND4_05424 [Vibrio sp. AND4]